MTKHTCCAVSSACLLLCSLHPHSPTADTLTKQSGVSLMIQTQKQDYGLTSLSFDQPALAPLATMKARINASSDIKATSIKLNHWVNPHINLFGVISKVTGEGTATLPALPGLNLPDVRINADGTTYSIGATAVAKRGKHFGAATYVYTAYQPDNMNTTNDSWSLTPAVGTITPIGIFSLGLRYQQSKGNYIGTTTTPLGEVNANIGVKNKDHNSWIIDYRTPLTDSLLFSTSAELGNRQGVRLELTQRF